MNQPTVELGRTYKDVITGFFGVATGFCEYISGCNQVLLSPLLDNDGKFREPRWFDVQRVRALSDVTIVLDNAQTPGPDIPAPVR